MKVKSVQFDGCEDVYNMEVEGTHDFAIQGNVIAHNCADEWRYMCMSRPIKPKLSKEEIAPQADPLNMIYGGNNGRN